MFACNFEASRSSLGGEQSPAVLFRQRKGVLKVTSKVNLLSDTAWVYLGAKSEPAGLAYLFYVVVSLQKGRAVIKTAQKA